LTLFGQQGSAWVYQRPNALNVSRLAHKVEVIEDDTVAIERVHQPDFEAQNTVIVASAPACDIGAGIPQSSSATVEASSTGYWRIATSSNEPAMLILGESDFSGWQATVDGEPAPSQKAFTTIRTVCVPAGDHVVEWHYRPDAFLVGGLISLVSLLLVGLALVKMLRGRANRRSGDDSLTA